MDNELLGRIKELTPKFNSSLANGLAVEHMMSVDKETGNMEMMKYVDELLRINHQLFPEGLVYRGSQVCSPVKHFEMITRDYNSKRIANIARNDTFLVKYEFSFKGEELFPCYVLLPYVRDGGIISLNGGLYNISPVLTDVGYSVLKGSIFIPFRRTKLTFNREPYSYYANNRREIVYVIWSMIHQKMAHVKRRDRDNRRAIESCLAHYFFCRFGVIGTFKQWANADVLIGTREQFPEKDYPMSHYVTYESVTLKGRHPTGSLVMVIPQEQVTEFTRMLVAGFFYVVDTFPHQFADVEHVDDTRTWQILLGRLVFGDFEHHGKLREDIQTHMHSFENSLDEMTRDELKSRDIHVANIWELLHTIMTDLSPHFYQSNGDEATMYGKRLMVLRYVMEEFNNAISLFGYGFQSHRDKEWTAQDIQDALKRSFKLNTCVRNLTSEHGEINTVSYPGDNKILRITSMLIPQDKARKNGGYSKGQIDDPSKLLHASIAEAGQFNNQPKNNPDGRARVNPNLLLEVNGLIRKNPQHKDLIARTQKRF